MLKYLPVIRSSVDWFEFFGAHDVSSASERISDADIFIVPPCFLTAV